MSHEIYYTSAPEGIKRGTSGFCTVAASENIPKALWDRLETLSAYRHQFSQDEGATNPISYAHWILGIAGKSHHVLSRICDSGVDHTQRTNAFAHHLVLEPAEIAAAAGGPAWMLEQPGVMMDRWNGQVGALQPSRLAQGDIYHGARICKAWAALTGDAGWGGHLADLFAKTPTRPVCILFSPGQELLPLMAESIALLPPAARWNVTFNTYFTSMPTSATCLWRCCLAGTPAAQIGLRYAAGGLVLDLTDRSRLPALPPGDYVMMARTGQFAVTAKPGPAKVAQPALAELKAKAAPAAKAKPGTPAPVFDPEGDEEERQAERQRAAIFDFAESGEPAPSAPEPVYDFREEAPAESPRVPARPRGSLSPARSIRRAEDALEEAERQAGSAAQGRRRQVLLLFACAIAALAVGTGVIFVLNHNSAPPELPPSPSVNSHPRPVESRPTVVIPDTGPTVANNTTQEVTSTSAPAQTQIVSTATQEVTPAIKYPDVLTLGAAIVRPELGTGFGDRQQTLPLKAADLAPGAVTNLRLNFFPAQPEKSSAGTPSIYNNKTLGTLSAVPGSGGGKRNVGIFWKPADDPGLGTEILLVTCDRSKPTLELTWHAAALMRSSGTFNYIFWTLQNSTLTLETAAGEQKIAMKPFVPGPLNFTDPAMDLTWPAELPRDVRAVEPAIEALPAGWKADWYLDWDAAIPAASRTAENASQVISFKKPTGAARIDAWFLLVFKPGAAGGGIGRVECTFAKTLRQTQTDQAKAVKDLVDIDRKISDLKNDPAFSAFGGSIPADLIAKQTDAQAAADAYKAALSGYNELTQFDVSFELSDKVRLAALHFQRPLTETGK